MKTIHVLGLFASIGLAILYSGCAPAPIAVPPLFTLQPPTEVPPTEDVESFEYATVAEALAALKARDDVTIAVSQGWTIVTEADGLTTWAFTPPDHPAHPAVVKRGLYKAQEGWQIKMSILCEGEKAACDQFVKDFEGINEQLRQYMQQPNPP